MLRAEQIENILRQLAAEAAKGLPGMEVQYRMASSDRQVPGFPRHAGPDARKGAVLILLYPKNSRLHVLFIQRPVYTGVHSGQISFPGGKQDPADADLLHTALREYEEETGAPATEITPSFQLTPLFIPVSNIEVSPYVAYTTRRPVFIPDTREVEFLIEQPLSDFLQENIISTQQVHLRDEKIDMLYFACESHRIWGATAMMLNELLELIRRSGISFPE